MSNPQQNDFGALPFIDVARYTGTCNGVETVARPIDDAYSKVGFGYLINHGIDQTLAK